MRNPADFADEELVQRDYHVKSMYFVGCSTLKTMTLEVHLHVASSIAAALGVFSLWESHWWGVLLLLLLLCSPTCKQVWQPINLEEPEKPLQAADAEVPFFQILEKKLVERNRLSIIARCVLPTFRLVPYSFTMSLDR